MHSLLTLIKVLALTITLGAPTAAFANVSSPTTIPPVEAPVEVSECLTPDVVVRNVIAGVPDADIKELRQGPPPAIVFTSPSMPTDFVVEFDENGCRTRSYTVSKVST